MQEPSPPLDQPNTNWLAIFILFLAGLVAAIQFSKMSPIMQAVGHDLSLGLVASGFSVSLLGIVGVLFAITMGAIVTAIGLKRGLLIALFGGGIIALLGALAPNGPLFLFSRFCEGFSHLLIVVCTPALMAAHAKPKDKPIALAIWGCFFGLGFAIASTAAPYIVPWAGWRPFLMCHGVAMLLVGVAASFVLARSSYADTKSNAPTLSSIISTHGTVFQTTTSILLALTFCAYTILFLAVLTFLTVFLQSAMAWPLSSIGPFMALCSFVSLAFTLAAGFLIRAGLSLFAGFAAAFLGVAVTAIGIFVGQPETIALVPLMLVMMACFGLLPGFAFSSVPEVAPTPVLAALTYSAIALFGNVGTFLGTPIFAASYNAAGWLGGAMFVVTMSAAGICLATLLNHNLRKKDYFDA